MFDGLPRLVIVGVIVAVAVILGTVVTRGRRRRSRRNQRSAGPSTATHLPGDDPHWLEYQKRIKNSPRRDARKAGRRKLWAAGSAGAVGVGGTDPGIAGADSGCSSGCGGGGGCGGGCGGG